MLVSPLRRRFAGSFAVLGLLGLALPALAHETGLSYLRIRVSDASLEIEVELGLGDAAVALGLPTARDPSVAPEIARELLWEQIAPQALDLERRVRPALGFWQDTAPCPLSSAPADFSRNQETGFARLRLAARCPAAIGVLGFAWTLPFASDPEHRALVSVSGEGATQSVILSARRQRVDLEIRSPSAGAAFATYLVEGVRHIASGLDHLLFLIALLLPAPLFWNGSSWSTRESSGRVIVEVLQTVTAFTVAHSITLCLSVLGALTLPPAATEAAIAASVAIAALNGIRPFLPGRAWRIAFAFGLLHGLGFARYLAELGLPAAARVSALLAFNLGVELGQLVVVAACLPLLLWLGRRRFYRRGLQVPASATIAAVASLWFVERLWG